MPIIRELNKSIDFITLHEFKPSCYPYILETAASTETQNHFSIVFAYPGQSVALNTGGDLKTYTSQWIKPQNLVNDLAATNISFTELLDSWFKSEQQTPGDPHKIPFSGGWFVYLGYELASIIEPKLALPPSEDHLPVAFATRIYAALVYDHLNKKLYAVAENDQQYLLDNIIDDIDNCPKIRTNNSNLAQIFGSIIEQDPYKYARDVNRIKQYIKNGDVFQVNLSRSWSAQYNQELSNAVLYTNLRNKNPSPFFGLALHDNVTIISSSPERLVRVHNNIVETRPIAGTRPRGILVDEDRLFRDELLAHPKERAEHIMLIDLERNDLGKICKSGSIKVDEFMTIESYAHVHHIVSNVKGQLLDNITPGQIISAVFPGGTITGCPKVRCMEIIAELEQSGRGAYTGSMGYINRDGNMDFNILIRSVVRSKQHISFRAGAGIVADSDPDKELEETRIKAKGIVLALGGNL